MKRIVVKIGSNILADSKEGLDTKRISSLASDISGLHDTGYEIVIVSSGAVAAGMRKLGLKEKPRDIKLKQAAAAVGQSSLMWAYERSFGDHGKKVAQVLLTRDDFSDRKRYINSKNTLLTLLSYKVIPIINENDTVATDEIKFGDNDHLASLVASLVELITFGFASGGNQVKLGLSRWTETGPCEASASAPCCGPVLPLDGIAQGAVNVTQSVYDPVAGVTLPALTFGEAAIDLTASGVFDSEACVSFGRAYVKSRSSDSFTASMKDIHTTHRRERDQLRNRHRAQASRSPGRAALRVFRVPRARSFVVRARG